MVMSTDPPERDALYFFPDEDRARRAWAVSHLLRYAQWDDIWAYVSRDEVRDLFPDLDLPETLAHAWARMLKVEAPVG